MNDAWWSIEPGELSRSIGSGPAGLTSQEAARRLAQAGPNTIARRDAPGIARLLFNQVRNPLVLILVAAAVVSIAVGEFTDASIVLLVVVGSALLGFRQEYRAGNAVARLRSRVTITSTALRDGVPVQVPSADIVPGDVVLLAAGSLIPADGVVLEADDCFVNQAVLTGETFPVEKRPGVAAANAALPDRTASAFMGTSVASGTARMLVVRTGRDTAFGAVADRLSLRPEETEFERGLRRFGTLLSRVMLVMVVIVLGANLWLEKPPIDSLLFALALAVGLAPELLPAILSITLSHGAQRMAARGVIVRRLNAIENLGSMDVLCTDKTGTLTEGVVRLDGAVDPAGAASREVLRLAAINASLQRGLPNPLDAAIREAAERETVTTSEVRKVDEIPYDFVRKRLSVVVAEPDGRLSLITKGALDQVLEACHPLEPARREEVRQRFLAWSDAGFRVLGVAAGRVAARGGAYTRDDEAGLDFAGFLLFLDPPKQDAAAVLADLGGRGVQLKLITGDNQRVARHVAQQVGLPAEHIVTGSGLSDLRDEALWNLAERTTIFAEVDPNQKERIILALRKTGHVVGYLGDGINDAPALHAADVGVSVNTAVDVAKEAADFVLLEPDLGILREGIDEGRRTFANTLKYILTTISANFGNMFSMAGASLLLPFLPLLASQILLNNFLSDIPAVTISGDSVDPEWVRQPRRWDTGFIRNYMVLFGLVSSIFDFLTFGILLWIFQAAPEEFRTGWFIESLLTELVIALVVRTRRPFFRSRPGRLLLVSTLVFVGITLVIPYLPFGRVFGFVPLPAPLLGAILGLTALYVLAAEAAKALFYRTAAGAAATTAARST